MRLHRGLRQIGKGELAPDRKSIIVTIRIAWWRIALTRLFGRRGFDIFP